MTPYVQVADYGRLGARISVPEMVTLAFDVGKTKCRAALFEGDRRVAETEHPGSSGVADPGGVDAALRAMVGAGDGLGIGTADAVCAGLAGLGRARQHAHGLATGLARRFTTDRVVLASDITTSHAGALRGAPGVVVAAGTGSAALAIDAAGRSAISSGWGYLLGDEGSGYAIGHAGLSAALREYDGRGGSAVLLRLAGERFGASDALPSTIHGVENPAREVAAFARDVAVAAREGDRIALDIWQAAGRALAETALAAGRRVFGTQQGFDVATTGGLFDAGPLLIEPFEDELHRGHLNVNLCSSQGDALDGARLLAMEQDLPHASLTLRPLDGGVEEST